MGLVRGQQMDPFVAYSMSNDHVTPCVSCNDTQIISAYHTQNIQLICKE